jgi:hypothetical protein
MSGFLARQAKKRQAAKRAEWQRLQAQCPHLAETLKALSAAFGKVKLLSWEKK